MKPVTLTALAGTGALTAALAALPLGGAAFGGAVGLALTGAGMIACGMAFRRHTHEAAAAEGPARMAPAPLAPVPRFFPAGGPTGLLVPFGRKGQTMSEASLTRDLVRRAERVCAIARARTEHETETR
ncbi:MAG: hypothetical protein KGL11_02755 [Alphaproteobacteria bacterium]|nr:hypothetical protein [Alphaproteobacteria bacterium]